MPRSLVGKLLKKLGRDDSSASATSATAGTTPAYAAPVDKQQAATILTRLRDASLNATQQQLGLQGTLEARRAAIVAAVRADDYASGNRLTDALIADLDQELADRQAAEAKRASDKLAFEAAAGTLLKAGGAVALAKALGAPTQALRGLRADLVAKEKAVNDLLMPATLNHAEATRKLPALAAAAKALTDAKAAYDQLKLSWDAKAAQVQEVRAKLAEAEALNAAQVAALKLRLKALDKAVADGDFQKALDALPLLRTDILAAIQRATERKACDEAYVKVAAVYKEAGKVPPLDDALRALKAQHQAAWNDFYADYSAGRYTVALPKLALVQSTSQAVIKGAMTAAVGARPDISPDQQAKADSVLKAFSEKDRQAVQALLDAAPTPKHQQNLQKAIACGHTPDELAAFSARIQGQDEQWLQDKLHLTSSTSGTGVQQQWVMSCQATTAQAVKAELDPIYALSLHDNAPDLHELATDDTIAVAVEQKQMLESTTDEALDASYQSGVSTRLAGETPQDAAALQKLIDDAPSNWEKNRVMEVIARPQKYDAASIQAYYDQHVKGKGGGEAIHKTVTGAPHHRGRFGLDLLNRQQAVTGLKYESKVADSSCRDAAVDEVADELTKGRPVPLVVGANDGETSHYVLAVSVHPGPPKTFFIHDPATGTTVARTEAQMKNNQLDLPSGWSRLNQYEKPSKA